MRYWLYKANTAGGEAGWFGDWSDDLFSSGDTQCWGGHEASLSAEVHRLLDDQVEVGDVVVAYQTDRKAVVGFCRIEDMPGTQGHLRLALQPIERLHPGFKIHQRKHERPVLASSVAVNGPVMLRELQRDEMEALVELSGAPRCVLQGKPAAGGYRPPINEEST